MSIIYTNRNVRSLLFLMLTLFLIPLQLDAQDELPLPAVIPSMIRQNANRIQHPESISRFLFKLKNLERGDTINVKILHIGDSHIYADLLTGMLRQLFQNRFGIGSPKQNFRFKLADFQDSLMINFITPYANDSLKKKGVSYYMAGANGAEYSTYNQKPEFFYGTASLQPDLVIISMGTNEAFGYLEQNVFENNIDAFISQIRFYNPGVDILITTPGDAMKTVRRKRIHNANIEKACTILIGYASNSNVAVWDLNKVMGGMGSMKKWFTAGLAQKDRVHYSKEGYLLQGYLLFKALMNELDKPASQH